MVRGLSRLLLCLSIVGILSACADIYVGGPWSGGRQQPFLSGAESGARLSSVFDRTDRREIHKAAYHVTDSPAGSPKMAWQNSLTGNRGIVSSGATFLVGFNSGEEIEAPVRLDTSPFLEPLAQTYVTTTNANVRLSPNTEGQRVRTLPEQTSVQAVGHDRINDWYLVAIDNRIIGYIYGPLLIRVEGDGLLLAGGDPAQPRLCRELTYEVTLSNGQRDAWTNGACRSGDNTWAIVGGRPLDLT